MEKMNQPAGKCVGLFQSWVLLLTLLPVTNLGAKQIADLRKELAVSFVYNGLNSAPAADVSVSLLGLGQAETDSTFLAASV